MNLYLEGYADACGGTYDSRYSNSAEYNRGWDAAVRGVSA